MLGVAIGKIAVCTIEVAEWSRLQDEKLERSGYSPSIARSHFEYCSIPRDAPGIAARVAAYRLPIAPVAPVLPAPSAPSAVAPIAPPCELDFRITLLLHVGVRILSLGAHFLDALLESSCGIVVRDVGVSGERTKYSRREHNSTGACSDDRSKPFLKPVPDGWFVGFHRFLSSRITHSRWYKLSSKTQEVFRSNDYSSPMST